MKYDSVANGKSKVSAKNNGNLHKLKYFIENLNDSYVYLYKVVQYLNVDKIMIQFKGLYPMPKINPKKTIKSGYKLWMIVDTDGHINKFDVHHREID